METVRGKYCCSHQRGTEQGCCVTVVTGGAGILPAPLPGLQGAQFNNLAVCTDEAELCQPRVETWFE